MNCINALNDMAIMDGMPKLSDMSAIPCYPVILQKVPYTVTALPPTQMTIKKHSFYFK